MIDTHCHLDVAEFDADRDAVLVRARSAGVAAIVVPAIHAAGWDGLLALCASADDLYPALGLHPLFLDRHRDADLDALERAIAEHRLLALGEIGLDYFLPELDRAGQLALFEAQLSIAKSAGLPVLLHVRKAHDDVLTALKRIGVPGGIAHAFNGSIQQAHRYLDLGFRLGFGGMLTFTRSSRLRRLAAELPGESIVLETDAPDMTVAAHRGERNSPEYLPDVLQALSEVRGESPDVLAALTTANARAVLPGLGGIEPSGSRRVSAPPP
ncbi:TatD family hydrolase [Thiocapsa marina]|uniref:TatD-related deoxyribonuclease n=1 Tax=Thiocapsa marina 5811 TaxID=768671 RepID=F9UGB0_9GAMM|nr:TatD family hydrolase [Thiocapsa marina]EGV16836.1 TatD-related deoxyribonuclease [Thiocapsa marina 5811]